MIKHKRAKPAVAAVNAAMAEENIRQKLLLLSAALSQASRPNMLRSTSSPDLSAAISARALPLTVRQFNLWSSESLSKTINGLPEFHRNAAVTLARHPLLRTGVHDVLVALRTALNSQTPAQRQEQSAISLRRRLMAANTMRQIAERELIASRLEVHGLRDQLVRSEGRFAALEREAAKTIADLRARIPQNFNRVPERSAPDGDLGKTNV